MKKLTMGLAVVALALSLGAALQAEVKIYNVKNTNYIATPHGEHIWELAGLGVKNTTKHSVAIVEIEPGKGSIEHFHPVIEETYYVLEGEGLVKLNGEEALLKKGDLVAIPPHTKHVIVNPNSAQILRLLVVAAEPWTPNCMEYTAQ